MKLAVTFVLISSLACSTSAVPPTSPERPPLQTVKQVDLNRYSGRWYEIARTPNRFEDDCVGDVRVLYEMQPDGKLHLSNECRKHNGKTESAHGYANVVEPGTGSKLRVTFFWPFFANYWIIELDPEYKYAVVGEPDRKYLWIISRTPQMDATTYNELIRKIASHGYDVGRISKTPQSGVSASAAR